VEGDYTGDINVGSAPMAVLMRVQTQQAFDRAIVQRVGMVLERLPGVEARAAAQRSLTGLALRLREQERAEPARLSLDAVIEHLGAGGVSAMDLLDDWCGTPPRPRRWPRWGPELQPWLVEPEPNPWLVDLFDAAARIVVGIHDEKVRVEVQDLVDRSLQSLGS
jgi:hypothetical protein